MRVEARIGRIIAVNGAALGLAIVILFVLLRLRLVISPLAFWLLLAVCTAITGGEVALWARRGVRAVEAGPTGLTLWRGPRLTEERIPAEAMRGLSVTRRLGRKRMVFRLPPRELTVRRFTVRLPRRLVLAEDAFSGADFAALLAEIGEMRARGRE
jgi:hypothetical protein